MSRRGDDTRPSAGKTQHIKLVLLGDQGVGKSCIALRFVRSEFPENSEATIGAGFLTRTVALDNQPENHNVKFDIWDTAGQERYRSLAPMYYRGAEAAVCVYDISDASTFTKAASWIKEIKLQASPNILITLAGNKADIGDEYRQVSIQDGKQFAVDNHLQFTETSAKTGMGVQDLFMTIASKLAKIPRDGDGSAVHLQDEQDQRRKRGCAC